MKYQYLRIDYMVVINLGLEANWLHGLADVEWRDDYQCFFVRSGTPSHTAIVMKYGDVFQ